MAEAKEPQKNREQDPPVPVVLAVVICDMAIRDVLTNKVSLIGLFSTIRATSFPCTHQLMTIYVALTGGHGVQNMEIRLVRAKDEEPLINMSGSVEFVGPLQVHELIFEWRGVQFQEQGDYLIEVCSAQNPVPLTRRKFSVIQLGQVSPTSGSAGG